MVLCKPGIKPTSYFEEYSLDELRTELVYTLILAVQILLCYQRCANSGLTIWPSHLLINLLSKMSERSRSFVSFFTQTDGWSPDLSEYIM